MDKKLISEAVAGLELDDIFLYTSNVKRHHEIYTNDYPNDMEQQSKLAISVDFFEATSADKNISHIIKAKVKLGVRFVVKEHETKFKTLAEIEATFMASYLQSKSVSEAAVEEFARFNVIHNVWPFWREHAFRMSAEAQLPKPKISFFHSGKGPITEEIIDKRK